MNQPARNSLNDRFLPRSGARVTLRRLDSADLPDFQVYRRDADVGRYQGWTGMSDAEALEFLAEMNSAVLFEPGKWCQIGIAEPTGGRLIGDIGVFISFDGQSAEIGFTLNPRVQGQGLASAAVRDAIKLIFEQTAVDRLIAVTDARNTPSIALLERIGMRRSESRNAVFLGEDCVELVYVLARPID
jgi:RimJ/RimL family protein N-acetyltransferase